MSNPAIEPESITAAEHLISAYNLDVTELNKLVKAVNDIAEPPASHCSSRYEATLRKVTEGYAEEMKNLIKVNAAWRMIHDKDDAAKRESDRRFVSMREYVMSLPPDQQESGPAAAILTAALPASVAGTTEPVQELLSLWEARQKRDAADLTEQVSILEAEKTDLRERVRTLEAEQRVLHLVLTQYLLPLLLKVFGNATENVSALAQLHFNPEALSKDKVSTTLERQYSQLLALMRATQRGEGPTQPPSQGSIHLGTGILPLTLAQFGHPNGFTVELEEQLLPMNIVKFSEMHAHVLRDVGAMDSNVLRAHLREGRGQERQS